MVRVGVMCGLALIVCVGCKRQAAAVDAGPANAPKAAAAPAPAKAAPPAPSAPPEATEMEPNDAADNATLVIAGKTVRGTIELHDGKADVDHFKVSSPYARGILRAEVSGVPGLDLVLEVFQMNPRERLIRVDNGRVGRSEVAPNVGVGVGDYVVVVRQPRAQNQASKVPYRLTVTVRPADEGEEREPNDSRTAAKERVVGKELRGYLGRKDDIDWFKFALPARTKTQNLSVTLKVPPGLDYDSVEVFDENEKLLKKAESTKGENVVVEGLQIEPTRKLIYVVLHAGKKFNAKKRYILATKLEDAR